MTSANLEVILVNLRKPTLKKHPCSLAMTSVSDWEQASSAFFYLEFLSVLVGKHLVNKWPFDPCDPSLSTFRTKWPLNGDVPAGMGASRLVAQPVTQPPLLPKQQKLPYKPRRCLREDTLIFRVNWEVLSPGPYSWQQLPWELIIAPY